MIFAIDHVVFATTHAQRAELVGDLTARGFKREAFTLEFPEIGAASESLSFGGGGFVEFVVSNDDSLSPKVWFGRTPRAIGLGFSSSEFSSDTDWWDWKDAWRMDEDHVLPDGSLLNIRAAGPHAHLSGFYIFVMERNGGRLQFPANDCGPRLEVVRVEGQRAEWWRRSLSDWLRMPSRGDDLRIGETGLTFADGPHPEVAVSLVFSHKGSPTETVTLAAGSLEVPVNSDVALTG